MQICDILHQTAFRITDEQFCACPQSRLPDACQLQRIQLQSTVAHPSPGAGLESVLRPGAARRQPGEHDEAGPAAVHVPDAASLPPASAALPPLHAVSAAPGAAVQLPPAPHGQAGTWRLVPGHENGLGELYFA